MNIFEPTTSHYYLWCCLVATTLRVKAYCTRTTSSSLLRTRYGLVAVYCRFQIQLRRHTTSHTTRLAIRSHRRHNGPSWHVNTYNNPSGGDFNNGMVATCWFGHQNCFTSGPTIYKEEDYYIFLFRGKPFGFNPFTQDDSAWPFISKQA